MKRMSRGLVIALVVVVALVGYNITFPAGKSATSNWTFVLTHPTLLLHVIVATGILVMAVIALIRSVRSRDRPWMALSVAGLAFVLAAFVSGEVYVMSLHKSGLNYWAQPRGEAARRWTWPRPAPERHLASRRSSSWPWRWPRSPLRPGRADRRMSCGRGH